MEDDLRRGYELLFHMWAPGLGIRRGEPFHPDYDIEIDEGGEPCYDDLYDYEDSWEWTEWPSKERFDAAFRPVRRWRRRLGSAAPPGLVMLHMAMTKARRDVFDYFKRWDNDFRSFNRGAQLEWFVWMDDRGAARRLKEAIWPALSQS